jgi:hypothetical protein
VTRTASSPSPRDLRPRSSPSRGAANLLRPYWWAVATVALVLLSALFARDPLRDAVTLGSSIDATLRRPPGYVLLSPLSSVLDTVSLLSLRQHIAVVVTLLLVWAAWWWRRGRVLPPSVVPDRGIVRRVVRVGLPLLGLVTLYVAAALLPRPMAAIDVGPRLVVVAFHAHTKYSHDGRAGWSAEDLRDWHRDAGFDVAYVSDHRTFEGAREGWSNDPVSAGEKTVLIPAIEVVWNGEHVNVLDADRFYTGLLTPTLRDIDSEALRLASALPGTEPVLIETLPGDLSRAVFAKGAGTAGARAIEIDDGAPQGLGQTRREHDRIVALADSLNLTLVSGSNHHGWGHTASAWTLFLLPQWRAMTPPDLSAAISNQIRRGGRRATQGRAALRGRHRRPCGRAVHTAGRCLGDAAHPLSRGACGLGPLARPRGRAAAPPPARRCGAGHRALIVAWKSR